MIFSCTDFCSRARWCWWGDGGVGFGHFFGGVIMALMGEREAWKFVNLPLTSQSAPKPCASYSNMISTIDFLLKVEVRSERRTRWDSVFEAVDCGEVVFRLHILCFLLPLSVVVKVDLSWNLHLADGVSPQCAQTRTLVRCCRCMGKRHDPRVKCLPKKTPVTVPTDEPFFLCSASWWQSELYSSFFFFLFIWCQEACDRPAASGSESGRFSRYYTPRAEQQDNLLWLWFSEWQSHVCL